MADSCIIGSISNDIMSQSEPDWGGRFVCRFRWRRTAQGLKSDSKRSPPPWVRRPGRRDGPHWLLRIHVTLASVLAEHGWCVRSCCLAYCSRGVHARLGEHLLGTNADLAHCALSVLRPQRPLDRDRQFHKDRHHPRQRTLTHRRGRAASHPPQGPSRLCWQSTPARDSSTLATCS